jgi:RNA polymerase sigma-70 factor (ECF subfamily)
MREDLVERARQGDREAFGELAAGEVNRLNAIARLVLRDPDLAEEAVQEALVRCWRQLPKLRDVASFDGWLYRILIRAAQDEVNRRRRFQVAVQSTSAEPSVADRSRDIADRDQLESGFKRLSVHHRAVVVLHHYVGLPMPQVAEALGIPEGTAKSRYHYAMAALRAALEADNRLDAQKEVPA